MQINIDTSKVVQFADKLESLSRNALPRVVKETLSKTALDVKKRTMPKSADRAFNNRERNFFKANSKVFFAKLGRIEGMSSTVGFVEGKIKGKDNFAVKDLEEQEHGGKIGGRKFIPLDPARTGKNRGKKVKKSVPKISELGGKIIKAYGSPKGGGKRVRNKKQRYVRAAMMAKSMYGDDAFVLGNNKGGSHTLSRIDQISSNMRTGKIKIKRTPLYSYKSKGTKKVTATGFMKRATFESSKQMNSIFIKEAQKQLERYLR